MTDIALAPDGSPAGSSQQYLRFSLGRDPHALRIEAVREILEVGHMTPLPLMPDFVRGVMNLRGAVVPVIDLGARIGLGATTLATRTCIVVVDAPARDDHSARQPMGVLVDAVHEVFDDAGRDAEAVPRLGTRVPPEFIRGMVRIRDRATPELDLEAILEHQALADLIARHTARSH